jgi:uncharacterized protein YbcC (UPF0753/DUF2309 family)
MNNTIDLHTLKETKMMQVAVETCRAIPPAWPLAATVAVNPYLGHADESLAAAGARLARIAGAPVTMPRTWYAERIESGEIADADIVAAIASSGTAHLRLADVKAAAKRPTVPVQALPTVADLATAASGTDWTGILADRFGLFASGYFDEGQALWNAPRRQGAWRAWRAFAAHDLSPEILGLAGFAAEVENAPDTAQRFIASAATKLSLPAEALPTYFHQLLMTIGGWSQLARQKMWNAELTGSGDETLIECLAIRLFWEVALYDRFAHVIADDWTHARASHAAPVLPTQDQIIDAILQEANERAAQGRLARTLEAPTTAPPRGRPALQAAFCIDVRSEVFRRALEAVNPAIETLGFAGFFGLGVSHHAFASDIAEARLPVLLNPSVMSCAGHGEDAVSNQGARIKARATRAWKRFKLAAVSSFAFVESAGPLYIGKLVRDGLGLARHRTPDEPAPRFAPGLTLDAKIGVAENILRAMSLSRDFARLVLLAGHGANVVNNPHASALHCGACGGYPGDVNARLLAGLLNDPEVRKALRDRGIVVPNDTLFVAALHDTTTDEVTLFDCDCNTADHRAALAEAREWLAAAGRACRNERAARLPRARDGHSIAARSRNWAEVRPEWALAGCQAFIAAPRSRTTGRNLGGRAFLHSYNWRADPDFKILELIMTAPVVVASWISLQYYGSTVSPAVFGAGNKLLHNVVGGIGVFEGNGGLLRAGLPWQSVHDGEKLVHDPLRLSVCIEAPPDAMIDILRRHDGVRALFDNRWLHLFALDEHGHMALRYVPGLGWENTGGGPVRDVALRTAS